MFFGIMLEVGLIASIIGGVCTGIGKLPMIRKMHEKNRLIKKQKKLEKENKKKK